jgi:hypothetical protein
VVARLLLALGLVAWVLGAVAATTYAQEEEDAPPDEGVAFVDSEAQPNFPEEVTFSLTAESADTIITEID